MTEGADTCDPGTVVRSAISARLDRLATVMRVLATVWVSGAVGALLLRDNFLLLLTVAIASLDAACSYVRAKEKDRLDWLDGKLDSTGPAPRLRG